MPSPIRVLGISGSLRKASFNTQLLRVAGKLMPEYGMKLEIFDLSLLPMYNSDIQEHGYPEAVEELHTRIVSADALLFATPEYNASITGALKNALDWASRPPYGAAPGTFSPLYKKPAAIVGVGGRFGTIRSQMHLRQIGDHVNMQMVRKPEVYISNFPTKAFDQDGDLVDANSVKFLKDLLFELATLTKQLRRIEEVAV